ncbi:hypothetical protein [Peribacillus butanolivorans]|uniref:hypothetical protein n=1 Tax=Peribacillus butanolivorans TaxID=421767 RepID=UPI0036632F29
MEPAPFYIKINVEIEKLNIKIKRYLEMYADFYHTCEQKNEKVQRNRLINYNTRMAIR